MHGSPHCLPAKTNERDGTTFTPNDLLVFAEKRISQPGSSNEMIFMKEFNPPRQVKNKLQNIISANLSTRKRLSDI